MMHGMLTQQHQQFEDAPPWFLLHIGLATQYSKIIDNSELPCQKYKSIASCRY
jgi:hypothetical protein